MLRPWQKKFVEASINALTNDEPQVIAIDSPTGSGKTLTALTIAKRSLDLGLADKVFFLVRTVTQVIPPIRDAEAFLEGLNVAPLVGKERACPLGGGSVSLCKICSWRSNLPEPPKSWLDLFEWIDKSMRRGLCPYMTLKSEVKKADVVVMPSAYMNPSIFKTQGFDVKNALLIFDEAHNLFNFMREESVKIGYAISVFAKFPKLMNGLKKDYPEEAEELAIYSQYLQKLRNALKVVSGYRVLGKGIRVPEVKEAVGKEIDDLLKLLDKIAVKLAVDSHPLFDLVEQFRGVLSLFSLASDSMTAVYLDGDTLRVKELKPWITRYLEMGAKGAILMSGTMPSPEFLKKFLGKLDLYLSLFDDPLLREEYFKYYPPSNMKVFLVTDYTSMYKMRYEKDNVSKREMLEKAAFKMAKILDGTVLMVYPSYAMLNTVKSELKVLEKKEGVEVLISERGGGAGILWRARQLKRCVIAAVAGDQLTEGVELTEDGRSLIKAVFIMGAPFPMPSAFLEDVAKSIDRSSYEAILNQIYEEEMIMKVKQALGRMIRSPKDKGIAVLGDYRFERFLDRVAPYREIIKVSSEELLESAEAMEKEVI